MPSPTPLRLLGIASVVLTALSWVFDKQGFVPWLSAALLNAGTGILTSIVIIYGYDQLISARLEKERRQRESAALSALAKITLRQHYRVLLDCYRSACDLVTAPRFSDVNEFLGPQYPLVFGKLDLYAPSPENSDGSTPYYQYIERSFASLHEALTSLLNLAGSDLSQDIHRATHKVLDSKFMLVARFLSQLYTFRLADSQHVPSQLVTGMADPIACYCAAFGQLLVAVERVSPHGLREYQESDWHNACFPPGHARLKP